MDYKIIIKTITWILIIGLISFYNIPLKVDKEIEAVGIKLNDTSYLETHKVTMFGYYRFNLFTQDTFEGQITILDQEITSEIMRKVIFYDDGGSLTYSIPTGIIRAGGIPEYDDEYFGHLLYNPFMHNLVIKVFERVFEDDKYNGKSSRWSSSTGYCIVSSVNNREEAIYVLEKYDILPPQ